MSARTIVFAMIALLSASAFADDKAPSPAAPPEPEGMQKIFTGKDLAGWDGDPRLWSAKDGVLQGRTTAENPAHGNTFLIWRGGVLGDFELRLSFRIAGGNSGIQYRAQHRTDIKENPWVVGGYQAEVEDTPGKVGFLYDERGRGYLCNVGEKAVCETGEKPKVVGKLGEKDAIAATYHKSEWNDYVIIGRGNVLKHYLNGVQTVEFTDDDAKDAEREGLLALQIHAGPPMVVEFKDIRLKQYPAGKESTSRQDAQRLDARPASEKSAAPVGQNK